MIILRNIIAAGLVTLATGTSWGQGVVTVTGTASVERPADALRVEVELMAKGEDMPKALAALKARRAAIQAKLAGVGQLTGPIEFGEPTPLEDRADSNAHYERMNRLRARMAGRESKLVKSQPASLVQGVRADFPLPPGDAEARLIASHDLIGKLKAADLGGVAEPKKATPQEAEIAEELGEAGGNENGPKRGEPLFAYVVKLTAEERDKLTAEAIRAARRDAERLAIAAGATLGEIRQLSETPSDDDMQRRYLQANGQRVVGVAAGETLGSSPGKIMQRVSVTVQYALQPGK